MSQQLLDNLLDRWEAARAAGQSLRPDELCLDHPELLPELLEQVRALAAMDGLLADAPNAAGSSIPSSHASDATDGRLVVGQEPIPGYFLVHRLGRGGSGEVWEATGPGEFPVALKFIRLAGCAGEIELRSLEVMKEARHTNLLATFGAWQRDDLLIVAMELADQTLLDRFDEARNQGEAGIPGRELLRYMAEAAHGLDFLNQPRASRGGIQHRDVKPQNLMLVGGSVKVTDFGLARVLSGTVTGHTGSMTPAYAAPEFFEGKTAQQSDQYSLAITYCHLRGGRLPFAGSAAEVMAGHLQRPPDLLMLLPEERPIVSRALSKSPSDRWPSCTAFVKELRNATAKSPSTRARQTRHWRSVFIGALAFIILASATLAIRPFFRQTDEAPTSQSLIDAPPTESERESPIPGPPPFSCSSKANDVFEHGHRLFLAQQNQEAIVVFNEALVADPKCASAFAYRGWAFARLRLSEKAIADANSALKFASSSDSELLAAAHYVRGHGYRYTNQLEKAIADYSATIQLKPLWAPAYHNRGLAYASKGDAVRARADQAKAKELGYESPKN